MIAPAPPRPAWEFWTLLTLMITGLVILALDIFAEVLAYWRRPSQPCEDCNGKARYLVTWFDRDVYCHSYNLCKTCARECVNEPEPGDSPFLFGPPVPLADNPFLVITEAEEDLYSGRLSLK